MAMTHPTIVGLMPKMLKNNDFHILLPSNSNPNTYPNNSASHFTVSWENQLILDNDDEWTVALTEMTYTHTAYTISPKHGVRFYYHDTYTNSLDVSLTIKNGMVALETNNQHYVNFKGMNWKLPTLHISNDGHIRIISSSKFALILNKLVDALEFGFKSANLTDDKLSYDHLNNLYFFSSNDTIDSKKDFRVDATLHLISPPIEVFREFLFENYYRCNNPIFPNDLVTLIRNYGQRALWLKDCTYVAVDKRIHLSLGNQVLYFKFLGGLVMSLGFLTKLLYVIKLRKFLLITNHN